MFDWMMPIQLDFSHALLVQMLVGGLVFGSIVALIALGLNIIFGVMNVINIGHGEFVMFGAFGSLSLYQIFGIHPIISLFLLAPLFFVVGILLHYLLIDRIIEKSDSQEEIELISLLVTLGLFLFLNNLGRAIWGTETRSYSVAPLDTTVSIGGANITYGRIFAVMFSIAALVVLFLFMTRTEYGSAMRATVQNKNLASSRGVNTNRIYFVALGLSTVLAGFAGGILGMIFPFTVNLGFEYLIFAFLAVILGGMGDFIGSLLGAYILGISGQVGTFFFGTEFQNLFIFIMVALVLAVKPNGILGGSSL